MSGGAGSAAAKVTRAFRAIEAVERPEVWITLREERDVLADAQRIDAAPDSADLPLRGVLIAVKDNIDVAGLPTTAACPEFAYTPTEHASAVARIIEAGAVVLGKTNLDQFATGLVGTRSPYGAVRHAVHPDRISGGSSSGSATAVALGLVDAALGTDTAGSGRVPAAFAGLVGIKPTLGLVPTTGVVPACVDYDTVTVFAADPALAAQVMTVMIGQDAADPRSRSWPADTRLAAPDQPRVLVPSADNLAALCPSYVEAFARTVDGLADRGIDHAVVDISVLLDAATLLYDGALVAQRYSAVGAFIGTAPAGADPTVAAIVSGASTHAAHRYVDDLTTLAAARSHVTGLLRDADALLLPTTTEHPTIAAVQADPLSINRRMGTYTNFCNLLDLAAVAVPGLPTAQGDPFGVTVVGAAFDDQVCLDIAVRLSGSSVSGPSVSGPSVLPAPAPTVTDLGTDVLVVGAHLRGFPLAWQLVERSARPLGPVRTSDAYRLIDLHTTPPKPGLVRYEPGEGAPIEGELYRMAPAHLGTFLAALPEPMGLGPVELEDGRWVVGFCCARAASERGTDITEYGGWRRYRERATGG